MKYIVKKLKKIENFSAIAVRLTKITGKSNVPIHPKHLIESNVWFAKYLKKNDIILDLGFGSGQTSIKIAHKVKMVIGLEIDEILVERAKIAVNQKNIRNVELLHGDANIKLPFKSDYFDKVICSDVLEHLNKRDFALSELKRVLKPGGILFLVTDNPDTSWKRLQKSYRLFYYADPDHKYEYSKKEIIQKLKKQKFSLISIDTITYDTPLKGLVDLMGGISLSLYKVLGSWRKNMVKNHPEDTTGYKIIVQKE